MMILLELLICFLQIGLFSIGGGYATIPLIQQQVVFLHPYLSMQEFTDIITISQMTPGPLAVNTSTFVGMKIAGLGGAIVASVGCVFFGIVLSLSLYKFFQTHRSEPILAVLDGLKASSIGLIASAASTVLILAFFGAGGQLLLANLNVIAIPIFLILLFISYKYKLNSMWILVISGFIGLIIY